MTVLQMFLAGFVVTFFCLLVGYAVGRRVGMVQAKRRADAMAVLQLRQKLLASGVCPTCDNAHREMVQYAKKG